MLKKAFLLHYAGEGVLDAYDTLRADTGTFSTARNHFKPVKLTQNRVYEFRRAEQLPGETLDAFVTRLRTLSREFTNVDNEIKSQIIHKCKSSKVRRRFFLDGITLKEVLVCGRAIETAEQEARAFDAASRKSVNKVYARKYSKPSSVRPKTTTTHGTICGHRGGVYPHKRQCPAYGQQCHSCGRYNHFARCCKSQKGQSNFSSKQYIKASSRQ